MGSDLKDAVGRGVDDPVSALLLLRAVIGNDLRARIGLVAQHAAPRGSGKGIDQMLRKTVGIGRQGAGRDQPRQLPMPDGGVLACRGFLHSPKDGGRGLDGTRGIGALDVKKTQRLQMGHLQRGRGQQAAQRVAAGIAEERTVGRGADAEAIQNKQENTFGHIYLLIAGRSIG